ncbi:inhibin beta B chain-like [Uloborus diversus]|uniref:inhibin beta B chain-like n=1 Tax=Uloborus diversus TaxID=327109 RepID=UPI0024095270|nr:inhibin beta B chain-like [Uloborus diversus]
MATTATTLLVAWAACCWLGSACPACGVSDRTQAARLKLEAIKRQILSKLHLQGRPNVSSGLTREVALEALRTRGALPEEGPPPPEGAEDAPGRGDDYYARTSEIIAFAEPGRSLNGHVLLDFYPSHEHMNPKLQVTAATLWIQLRRKNRGRLRTQDQSLTLYVFRVGNSTEHMHHLASYRQEAPEDGWRQLDVGNSVQQWFSGGDSREKLTLLVDCVGCDSKFEIVLFDEEDSITYSNNVTATATARKIRHGGHQQQQQLMGLRPFLVIATETTEQRRSRRHSRSCGGRPSHCCRQKLYVSFDELGWGDWIIAPKGYYANFCMGSCNGPRTPDTYPTFHTHVIEEYRSRNPYASIHPCCAPTRLSPMSLIYFDPDLNIIKTDLPKMIVEDCGCT